MYCGMRSGTQRKQTAVVRRTIPLTVIRRLTKYLAFVQESDGKNIRWISSGKIAEQMGLTSSTVRQDLMHVNYSGRSKRGYETAGLASVLKQLLGADKRWRMVVVGAGNLGRALALHEDFARRGFSICGLFDTNPAKIGQACGNLRVQSMAELAAAVGHHRADIGVIAVPGAAAQRAADLLIAAGIRGLLNMSPASVIAPKRVAVVDARIVASLLELSHAILAMQAARR